MMTMTMMMMTMNISVKIIMNIMIIESSNSCTPRRTRPDRWFWDDVAYIDYDDDDDDNDGESDYDWATTYRIS